MDEAVPLTVEISLSHQIIEAAATFLTGTVLGLIYEMFGVVRHRHGAFAAVVCDGVFCVCAACALFVLGMGPGGGELRLYMLPVALGGALFFSSLFGLPARRTFGAALNLLAILFYKLCAPLRILLEATKKIIEFFKNTFSRIKKWFTIQGSSLKVGAGTLFGRRKDGAEAHTDETQKGKYFY